MELLRVAFLVQWNMDFMFLKGQFKMKIKLRKFMQLFNLNTLHYCFLKLKM